MNKQSKEPRYFWNENSLVVDAWMGSVYTKKGFCVANAKLPHYNISNNITGETQGEQP
jgi:hypothetical protein